VSQFNGVDTSHFAVEHGQPATEPLAIAPSASRSGVHGEAYWNHQNSVFNARTFFQVGPVLPSRRNSYGVRATTKAGPLGYVSFTGSQQKIRGMVNGNVLVPSAAERTPLAPIRLCARWCNGFSTLSQRSCRIGQTSMHAR
jgi:hypothetical protein